METSLVKKDMSLKGKKALVMLIMIVTVFGVSGLGGLAAYHLFLKGPKPVYSADDVADCLRQIRARHMEGDFFSPYCKSFSYVSTIDDAGPVRFNYTSDPFKIEKSSGEESYTIKYEGERFMRKEGGENLPMTPVEVDNLLYVADGYSVYHQLDWNYVKTDSNGPGDIDPLHEAIVTLASILPEDVKKASYQVSGKESCSFDVRFTDGTMLKASYKDALLKS